MTLIKQKQITVSKSQHISLYPGKHDFWWGRGGGGGGGGGGGVERVKAFSFNCKNKALQPRWCEEVYSRWSNCVFSIFYQKTVHLSLYWYKEFIPTTNTASTPATTGINIAYILSGKYLWITWSASTKGYNTQIKLKGRKNGTIFEHTFVSVYWIVLTKTITHRE
jgi:hypothetical protein